MVNTGMLENYIEKERIGGKNTRKNYKIKHRLTNRRKV